MEEVANLLLQTTFKAYAMKKILLTPDSFKGTMTSAEVCGELAAAIRGIYPQAEGGVPKGLSCVWAAVLPTTPGCAAVLKSRESYDIINSIAAKSCL